jgi:hypothetical protein
MDKFAQAARALRAQFSVVETLSPIAAAAAAVAAEAAAARGGGAAAKGSGEKQERTDLKTFLNILTYAGVTPPRSLSSLSSVAWYNGSLRCRVDPDPPPPL